MDVHLDITMPDSELEPFLLALRGWERARPEIELHLRVHAPTRTMAEVQAALAQLDPPLTSTLLLPFPGREP